jgi:glycerophosphoryl diester phosphodiesterase
MNPSAPAIQMNRNGPGRFKSRHRGRGPLSPPIGRWRTGVARARSAGFALLVVAALVPSPSVLAFDLQGHRGARGLAPENTLPGFDVALAVGVRTLELDIGLSRDDVLVVAHDRTLSPDLTRDASGRWLAAAGPTLRSLDFAALQAYDVGRIRPESKYAAAHPAQRPVDGARIPSLDQVFERVAALGGHGVRFNIETKLSPLAPEQTADPATFARRLVDALRRHGVADRSTVQSFDWRTLREVQRLAPDIATAYLSVQQPGFDTVRAADAGGSPWTAGLRHADHGSVPKMVVAAGGRIWSPNAADLDAGRIAEARALGLKVLPWTVNDPETMGRLMDWGVDGLITDRPDLLREVMAARGLPLPPKLPAVSSTVPASAPAAGPAAVPPAGR